jgi:hypothetical protein
MDDSQLKRLADIAVDVVQPAGNGFALSGQGSDRGEYRLEVHFDMPLDARTRAVLGGPCGAGPRRGRPRDVSVLTAPAAAASRPTDCATGYSALLR